MQLGKRLSNEKKILVVDYTTRLCGDYFINHYKDPGFVVSPLVYGPNDFLDPTGSLMLLDEAGYLFGAGWR